MGFFPAVQQGIPIENEEIAHAREVAGRVEASAAGKLASGLISQEEFEAIKRSNALLLDSHGSFQVSPESSATNPLSTTGSTSLHPRSFFGKFISRSNVVPMDKFTKRFVAIDPNSGYIVYGPSKQIVKKHIASLRVEQQHNITSGAVSCKDLRLVSELNVVASETPGIFCVDEWRLRVIGKSDVVAAEWVTLLEEWRDWLLLHKTEAGALDSRLEGQI